MTHMPPNNLQAEQAVLGAILLDNSALQKISWLGADDFYRPNHREAFSLITDLIDQGEAADAVTVGERFDALGRSGMSAEIIGYASEVAGTAGVVSYASIVREKAQRRRVIEVSRGALDGCLGEEDLTEVVEQSISSLLMLQSTKVSRSKHIKACISEALQLIEEAVDREPGTVPGITTGLRSIDHFLGGFHDTDLTIIGARPSVGKTALMGTFIEAPDCSAGVFSAEMAGAQLAMRHLSSLGQVQLSKMRSGEMDSRDFAKLSMEPITNFANRSLFVDDSSSPDISDVVNQARKWSQEHQVKIIYLDYVQIIKSKGIDAKSYEIGDVCWKLKNLAKELKIPVVALAQINRKVEQYGSDYMPKISDLKDSGEIEQHADQIIMLTRPHVLDPEEPEHLARIGIRKNRHGPCAQTSIEFNAKYVQFRDLISSHV